VVSNKDDLEGSCSTHGEMRHKLLDGYLKERGNFRDLDVDRRKVWKRVLH